jgi:hypothetical protein
LIKSRPAQPCMISALTGHTPKACCAGDTNIARSPFCWAVPSRPAQYSLCKPVPLRPAKPGTCTRTIPTLLDHVQQKKKAGDSQTCRISTPPACTLQACQAHAPKPSTSPQLKASTRRPMGPHSPSTCHKKVPNLPKRCTQTGLDAKELGSEQL